VTVTCLTKDLKQCWIRDEKESRKDESFALQISVHMFHLTFTHNLRLLILFQIRSVTL